MKIIFLDIDGVLNSDDDTLYVSGPNKGQDKKRAPHICGYIGIDYKKVKKLAKIVQATDAKIVLVSSWKTCYEQYIGNTDAEDRLMSPAEARKMGKYLADKLAKENLKIYDTTYSAEHYYDEDYIPRTVGRGRGIRRWLVSHQNLQIEEWIALDDESYTYEREQLNHLIQTDPFMICWKDDDTPEPNKYRRGGLTDVEVELAINYLNNGVPPMEETQND